MKRAGEVRNIHSCRLSRGFLLVTAGECCTGHSIVDRLVRPDRVVDDPESVYLHVQGIAVGNHAAEQVFVFQGAEEALDHAIGLRRPDPGADVSQQRVRPAERGLENLAAEAGTVVRHHRVGAGAEHLPGRTDAVEDDGVIPARSPLDVTGQTRPRRTAPAPCASPVSETCGWRFTR